MLKKSVLLFAVLLFVAAAAMQAQDYSQMEQIQKQFQQLTADYQAGKITTKQYQEQAAELSRQLAEAGKAVQQQGATFTVAQIKRIETILDESKRLEALHNEGRITDAEFTRQATPLSNEYDKLTVPLITDSYRARVQLDEIGEKIKKLWPGPVAGWPPMHGDEGVVDVCGYGPFTQSAGTRASFLPFRGAMTGPVHSFIIYQTGATQATFDELRRQVERTIGKPIEKIRDTNIFRAEVPNKIAGRPGYHFDLILKGDTLTFRIALLHS